MVGRRVRFAWDREDGAALPAVAEGEPLTLLHGGAVLLRDAFAPD